MKSIYLILTVLFLSTMSLGCQGAAVEPTSTATSVATSTATATSTEFALPNERILILEPASGSRIVSPVRVSGVADSTFEQTLVVRILSEDGSEIALEPVMIRSELGQRGPFEIEIDFGVTGDRQAFIQALEHSARDGEIIHLSAVGVIISESGPEEIRLADPRPEQIMIFQPTVRELVQGGVALVRGYGWASFEQTLLVEVQDENGKTVGSVPVLVEAPDLGQPGHFAAEVPYQVDRQGPGRILIRDISPAFGGDIHRTSVEIDLAP